jgi:AraC family transcriptional regulator, transcriptional activator of pobA
MMNLERPRYFWYLLRSESRFILCQKERFIIFPQKNRMSKKIKNIPVNSMADNFSKGISIEKIRIERSNVETVRQYEAGTHSHRDEGHTFHIVEKGTVDIQIDFRKYRVKAHSVVYMHPNQVHRILAFENITICTLAISNENLNPDYLQSLEGITPAKPMQLSNENYLIVADIFSLCLNFSLQKNNRIHYPLLRDSCNTLIAFLISQFLNQTKLDTKVPRFEIVAKRFRQLLEKNYCAIKRPSEYAAKLNITTSYLNECIKNTSGFSVSQHIRDRNILEAKRLLYHTDKSVKEIAFELGYTDYPYFTRMFRKATGMSALSFRHKNRD